MKSLVTLLFLLVNTQSFAKSSWVDELEADDKQQQLDLRWIATGGEIDVQLDYKKLEIMGIHITPQPEFPNKSWESNHLVFPFNQEKSLELMAPYGSIEKATAGSLQAKTNFSFHHSGISLHIAELNFIPVPVEKDDYDIVVFNITDQHNQHLFTTNNVHIRYDKDRKLLLLENMDILATNELATLLKMPELTQQGIGLFNTYNLLSFPDEAKFSKLGGNCLTNPNFQNGVGVDVKLVKINFIDWKGIVSGTDNFIVAPSAELENVGTADVPWIPKFSSNSPPYNNDQHPFLIWNVYREIEDRFEQIGVSGIKHAFFSTNIGCDCPGGYVLGVGCGDVYSSTNNDSASALGPRDEVEANTGIWENCGTFFDPVPCSGHQQNTSNASGQHRLSLSPADIAPNLYMQAWYVVRDDVNIFNSMGYLKFSPTLQNTTWVMNPESISNFKNGAVLDNYVNPLKMAANEYTDTVETGEGQFTVAVKVIDLGDGLYRYNYAVDNYEFDPKFISYQIPMPDNAVLTDTVFSDPEHDESNDWLFSVNDGYLSITGNAQNEQDWGMMFSFSFTTDAAPVLESFKIDAAHINELVDPINQTVEALSLIPDLKFKSGFE